MSLAVAALALEFLAPQDDTPQQVRALIERLRSDNVEERDSAYKKLKELGPLAEAALEKAGNDPDKEVAGRARSILRVLHIREILPDAVINKSPGLADRLAGNDAHLWSDVFRQLTGHGGGELAGVTIHPKLLVPLVIPAVRGAVDDNERDMLALIVDRNSIPLVSRDLLPFLKEPAICKWVAHYIGGHATSLIVPDLLPFLQEKEPTKSYVIDLLIRYRAKEAIPFTLPRLKEGDPNRRAEAATALGEMGDRSAVAHLAPLLADRSPFVSGVASFALAQLGAKEHAPSIVRLLKEGDVTQKYYAVRALGLLQSREHAQDIIPLLQHSDQPLAWAAIEALGQIGSPATIPDLRKLLDAKLPLTRELASEAIRKIEGNK